VAFQGFQQLRVCKVVAICVMGISGKSGRLMCVGLVKAVRLVKEVKQSGILRGLCILVCSQYQWFSMRSWLGYVGKVIRAVVKVGQRDGKKSSRVAFGLHVFKVFMVVVSVLVW